MEQLNLNNNTFCKNFKKNRSTSSLTSSSSSSTFIPHTIEDQAYSKPTQPPIRIKTIRTSVASPPTSSSSSSSTRKRTSPTSPSSFLVFCIFLLITMNFIHKTNGDCPKYCDCKWKGGKETVLCTNVNLTIIPHNLDAGTQVLDLTGNEITKILHDAFLKVGLINLQKVYLAKCKLKMIDRYAFRKIKNLVELDLSYNALNVIPTQIFGSIGELRELKLMGNPIQKITNEAFINLPQLFRLDVSACKINTVERNAFSGIESTLEWLKLDGNRIMDLHSSTITSLENLNGIELQLNPWNCSCVIKPLIEWLQKHKISQTLSPVCRHPLRLLNKSWERLRLEEFACLPQLWTISDSYTEIDGSNVTLRCEFGETVEPMVQWRFNNKYINLEKKFNQKKYFIELTENSTNLIIYDIDQSDNGHYTCSIENKAGKIEKTVQLEVTTKDGLPQIQKIIVFIVVIIFLLFIIFVTFVISIFLWRRKRKNLRKNYKKTPDYEKIDRFNLAANSNSMGHINQINANSSTSSNHLGGICGVGVGTSIAGGGCSGGSGSGGGVNCGKIVKVEDFPLRQYREYKHIPSDDDDDDDYDYGNHNNDDDDNDVNQIEEIGNSGNLEFGHIGSTKTCKNGMLSSSSSSSTGRKNNRQKTKILLNTLTNCRREGPTTNWGKDGKETSIDDACSKNVGGRDQNFKRQYSKTTPSKGDGNIVGTTTSTSSGGMRNGGLSMLDDDDDDNLFEFNSQSFDRQQQQQQQAPTTLPLKGFKPNFTQHIMTKKNLQNSNNASLYTSEIFDDLGNGSSGVGGGGGGSSIVGRHTSNTKDTDDIGLGIALGSALSSSKNYEETIYGNDNKFPDLLDLPKFTNDSQNYYENYFNMYSTLPITKTINSTNYYSSKDRMKNINCDDSQASLLSSSSNEKIIPSSLSSSKRMRVRRYSVDSYSYIPSSSNSSSSFSLMTTTTPSLKQTLHGKKQRSSSYLNLVSPESKYLKTNPYPSLPSSPSKSKTKELHSTAVANILEQSILSNKPLRIPSTATPLLDFSSFPIHSRITASACENPNQSSKLLYDYHTTQLEYFIQEYRKLQDQLKKIGGLQLGSPSTSSTSSSAPSKSTTSKRDGITKVQQIDAIGQSAKFADPLMYNDAWSSGSDLLNNDNDITMGHHQHQLGGGSSSGSATTSMGNGGNSIVGLGSNTGNSGFLGSNTSGSGCGGGGIGASSGGGSLVGIGLPTSTTSILKKKQLVNWNKSPDPPPYWLHRNTMIKQLNNNSNHHNHHQQQQQQQQQSHHNHHNINNNNSSNNNNNNRNKNNGAPKS